MIFKESEEKCLAHLAESRTSFSKCLKSLESQSYQQEGVFTDGVLEQLLRGGVFGQPVHADLLDELATEAGFAISYERLDSLIKVRFTYISLYQKLVHRDWKRTRARLNFWPSGGARGGLNGLQPPPPEMVFLRN